jgi:CRISPR system Cascade subunit CasB
MTLKTLGAVAWWRDLVAPPDHDGGGDRAAAARLRRASTIAEAMMEPAALALFRRVGATRAEDLPRVAMTAAILAHLRIDVPGQMVARIIGPEDPDRPETAILKPLRFKRLLEAEGEDEQLAAFRRLLRQCGGTLPVTDLAQSLLDWNDARRRRWVFDYWRAEPLAPVTSSSSSSSLPALPQEAPTP